MTSLPSVGDLLGQSWQFFITHWRELIKRAAWVLLVFLAYIILAVPAATRHAWGAYGIAFALYIFGLLWAVTHLCLYIIQSDRSTTTAPPRRAIDFLAPTLWIGVLTLLILGLAGIVFILPAVWLAISFSFSYFFLLEDNLHGREALRASYNLVKGRWWSTLWRILAPTFLVGILIWLASMAIWTIVGLVAGGSLFGIFAAMGNGSQAGLNIAGGFAGVLILGLLVIAGFLLQVGMFFFAFTYPLILRTKLFHALKGTVNPRPRP